MHYYDMVLTLIPALFLLTGLASIFTGVSMWTATVSSGVLSILIVSHGLFVNPPKDE